MVRAESGSAYSGGLESQMTLPGRIPSYQHSRCIWLSRSGPGDSGCTHDPSICGRQNECSSPALNNSSPKPQRRRLEVLLCRHVSIYWRTLLSSPLISLQLRRPRHGYAIQRKGCRSQVNVDSHGMPIRRSRPLGRSEQEAKRRSEQDAK